MQSFGKTIYNSMKEGWTYKTLGELFDIGSSKRVFESQWKKQGIPFYRAREIVRLSKFGKVDNELFIDEELYNEYAQKYGIPCAGDLMVTGVGTLGVCYVVKPTDKFYFKDGNTLWFKTKEGTNPYFVDYAFKSSLLRRQIDNSNGATVGTFTIERAKKTIILCPPFEEQARIVSELDLITDIVRRQQEQLAILDELELSIFYDSFGNPVTNPKDWQTFSLSDITSLITDGSHYSPKNDEMGTIPMLSVKNMGARGFDYTDCKMISQEEYVKLEAAGCKPMPDDVLVAKDGSYFKKIFVHQSEAPQAILSSIAIVRPDQSKVTPEFLCSLLSTPDIYNLVEERYLTGTAIKRVILKGLRQLKIIVPPLEMQKHFSEKIWRINAQRNLIEESVVEAQKLFDSRMNYYFGD